MNIITKRLLISSAIALCLSQSANASITVSMKSVCDNAIKVQQTSKTSASATTSKYTSLLSSHYNATSCNGQQLLEQVLADNSAKLSANDVLKIETDTQD